MQTTALLKLASTITALVLSGTSAFSFAASGLPTQSNSAVGTVYQDASAPPDCDKTPEDPRCKDKK